MALHQPPKFFAPDENPCVGEMTCSICLNVWMDPVELRPCCHTYCSECLGTLSTCPDCRADVKDRSKPNRILTNLLYVLAGSCNRCGWRGTHGEFSGHHMKVDCEAPSASAAAMASKNTSVSHMNQNGGAGGNSSAAIGGMGSNAPSTTAFSFPQITTDTHATAEGIERIGGGDMGCSASAVEAALAKADMTTVSADGVPTCMLFPTLPEEGDEWGSLTGLEKKEGGAGIPVMISTATKPWREYGLTREQYEAMQLAFFAFADRVTANEAPFPSMAADDRDHHVRRIPASARAAPEGGGQGSMPSSLSNRSILLLKPEAVKRCLWWLNMPLIDHDTIVDELFTSFDIHLPLLPGKVERVNEGKVLRPLEGPLSCASDDDGAATKYIVYGVTMHQYLNWLGWQGASKLSPPLADYGLSQQHYDSILAYARTLDMDQTGAFDPEAVKALTRKLVEIRANGPHAAPVSIRPSEVMRVMMERRASATNTAAARATSKLILVGPSYPPGEFLLHDVLIACKHAEVGSDWCDVDDETSPERPPPPSGTVSMNIRPTPAASEVTIAGATATYRSGGEGSTGLTPPSPVPPPSSSVAATSTTTAAPPPKVGIFKMLFGTRKSPSDAKPSASSAAPPPKAPPATASVPVQRAQQQPTAGAPVNAVPTSAAMPNRPQPQQRQQQMPQSQQASVVPRFPVYDTAQYANPAVRPPQGSGPTSPHVYPPQQPPFNPAYQQGQGQGGYMTVTPPQQYRQQGYPQYNGYPADGQHQQQPHQYTMPVYHNLQPQPGQFQQPHSHIQPHPQQGGYYNQPSYPTQPSYPNQGRRF